MMEKVPVSCVIITKNEEVNIDNCLKSIHGWADEIVVVDDESSDRTVELAKRYTDKIFYQKMHVEGKHRNWAYAQASNNWIFTLDADERVSEELKSEISQVLSKDTAFVGFSIPRRNLLGDYWLRWADNIQRRN